MNSSSGHQAISELLPFFANGSLREAERAQVEAHVSACLVCRAELAHEQMLVGAFRTTDSEERLRDDGFARIMARVKNVPAPAAATPVRLWHRRPLRRLVRPMALVATLTGIGLGIVQIQGHGGVVNQSFQTLSSERGHVVGADIVYVAFNPVASMGAVHAALSAVHGEVVSGPNRDHVFSVRVPADGVAAAVGELKARAEVVFVAAAAPDTIAAGTGP